MPILYVTHSLAEVVRLGDRMAVMREGAGFRMGPFELMDLIGHDVNFAVTRSVHDAYFGDPRFTPSLIQQELVDAGRLGRKTGLGFFAYGEGAARPMVAEAPAGPRPGLVRAEGPLGSLAPRVDQLLLDQGRGEPRIAEVGVVDRAGDGEVHVVADQVHQLERAHAESRALAHHRVQGGRVAGAFLHHSQGLGVVGTGHPVDDEAGCGAGDHRALAPGPGEGDQRLHHLGGGRQSLHHLHQGHHRGGVEEMQAGEALGPLQGRGDGGDRQGRGVAGQDRVVGDQGFEGDEQRLLDLQLLLHRLDHQAGVGEILQPVHGNEAIDQITPGRLGELAAGHQLFQRAGDPGDRRGRSLRTQVVEADPAPRRRRDLGDARAHGPRADDQDGVRLAQPHSSPSNRGFRFSRKAASPSR